MEVIYVGEDLPETITKSLFLAGPTPRNPDEVESWRPDALQILEDKGFKGTVLIPEPRDGKFKLDYVDQVDWEEKFLNIADCIAFWVPRDLELDSKDFPKMAAFTTNVEFGAWADSGKIVFGAPPDSPKNDYLEHYAKQYNAPISSSLVEILDDAMQMLGDGAEREGGERFIPLFIWNTGSFQSWYKAQTEAGNRLDEARLLYNFRPKYKSFVFLWVLKAKIWIDSEKRFKENEFVLSRPDISSVCLYHYPKYAESVLDNQVIIVKEFRTPSSSPDGFVRELPSGSSVSSNNAEEIAAEEVFEETGFRLEPSRLKDHGARQLAGTFSAHKSHLFSAEITAKELKYFQSQEGTAHGNEADSERTFIEIYSIKELIDNELVDWTTLGMIFQSFNDQ